jgi:hypothetical protein
MALMVRWSRDAQQACRKQVVKQTQKIDDHLLGGANVVAEPEPVGWDSAVGTRKKEKGNLSS